MDKPDRYAMDAGGHRASWFTITACVEKNKSERYLTHVEQEGLLHQHMRQQVDTSALLEAMQRGPADESVGNVSTDRYTLFLQLLGERLQRVSLSFPSVEVRWHNLQVEVDIPARGPKAHTVLSAATAAAAAALSPLTCLLPTVPDSAEYNPKSAAAADIPTADTTRSAPTRRMVLDAGSGMLSPGRLCLLLGPPGAGKTTILRVLAGQALPPPSSLVPAASRDDDSGIGSCEKAAAAGGSRVTGGLHVRGRVTYNGLTPGSDFMASRLASYTGQSDEHIGELTVEETLMFAAECQGPGLSEELHRLLLSREAAAGLGPQPALDQLWCGAYGPQRHALMAELFARLLGIDDVMHTVVGNEMLKGISGGQRRRVTCGEMAVGFAQVMMLDEITNGLDSNSALAIIRSLRDICSYAQATMLVSLLQPSPEVFECFDDVMLLSGGRLVFLGPRTAVMPFFSKLGLKPPPTKTDPDFLQEILASPQAGYRGCDEKGAGPSGQRRLPPGRLRQDFDASTEGGHLVGRLAAPHHTHELQELVFHKDKYALSPCAMWRAVLRREALLFRRNKLFLVMGVVQSLLTGFLVSTTFIRMPKDSFQAANLHLSVCFFSLMHMLMFGFHFAPIYCQRLSVFYKQRDQAFYSPAAYGLSCFVMRMPDLVVQTGVYAIMVYFSGGFEQEAGRFFIFWLNLVSAGLFSVSLFQLLGAITRHDVISQGLGGVVLMLSVLASGFPIARTSIPSWWIWLYWANPMSWLLRSMAVGEFTGAQWRATSAAKYGMAGASIGEFALMSRGFFTDWQWVWAGIGCVAGQALLLLGAQVIALGRTGASSAYRPPLDDLSDGEEGATAPAGSGPLGDVNSDHSRSSYGMVSVTVTLETQAPNDGQDDAPLGLAGSRPCGRVSVPLSRCGAAIDTAEGPAGGYPAKIFSACAADPEDTPGFVAVVMDDGVDSDSLSFEPVVMGFKGINYFVANPIGGGELQLLRDVSGVFLPGVLTSLMGASGAGKTTLMDVLAGRKTGGREEGLQVVNQAPKRMATFARRMGYVEQFDAHNPQATVEEALLFSALLRVPLGLLKGRRAVRAHVAGVMEVVELSQLAGHTVGAGPGGGCGGGGLSTEARKRLTIACELVANPAIVFLDEPTTGLDARAAGMVMHAVRNMAATGRTVVCTIHQPNREILDYFDELLLLKAGGRVIFNGELGCPNQQNLITHLESIPGVPRYEPLLNPANWMLEVTSPSAETQLGKDFAQEWERSSLAAAAGARVDQHCALTSTPDPSTPGTSEAGPPRPTGRRYAQSSAVQLYALVRRGLVSYWRNPAYNLLRLAVTVALGLALGTLYWGRGSKGTSLVGVLDIMGSLYCISLFLAMVNCLTVMPVVMAERAVFYRERASGMYGSLAFTAAQGFTEFPYLFVQSVLYVVIVYCTAHFEFTAAKALWFWLFIWLNLQAFTFLGMGVMNLTPSMPACVAAASLFVMLWNLFCGFLIARNDLKRWWLWAYYFNPATYAIYGCVTTQLGDNTQQITVGPGQIMSVANYVDTTFDYQYGMRGWLVLIMVGFIALFRILSYVGLSCLNFQVR